jgi:hypothetical protein
MQVLDLDPYPNPQVTDPDLDPMKSFRSLQIRIRFRIHNTDVNLCKIRFCFLNLTPHPVIAVWTYKSIYIYAKCHDL